MYVEEKRKTKKEVVGCDIKLAGVSEKGGGDLDDQRLQRVRRENEREEVEDLGGGWLLRRLV